MTSPPGAKSTSLRGERPAAVRRVLGIDVVDDERDMPVAIAELVGLSPALVDGQLELEICLGVTQVNQREPLELEPVRDREAESLLVEPHPALLIEHPDHRMNGLRHVSHP